MASRQWVWPGNESVPESVVFPLFLFPVRKRTAPSLIFLSVKCFLSFFLILDYMHQTSFNLHKNVSEWLSTHMLRNTDIFLGQAYPDTLGGIYWLSACWLWFLQEVVAHWIAECRLSIEQARLLTLKTASKIDMLGNRKARREVKCFLAALG